MTHKPPAIAPATGALTFDRDFFKSVKTELNKTNEKKVFSKKPAK